MVEKVVIIEEGKKGGLRDLSGCENRIKECATKRAE